MRNSCPCLAADKIIDTQSSTAVLSSYESRFLSIIILCPLLRGGNCRKTAAGTGFNKQGDKK